MTVLELIWKATQQVVITKQSDPNTWYGFGSGFFLRYKKKLFFITARHVVFDTLDSEKDGNVATDEMEHQIAVVNNVKGDDLSTATTPISGIYTFDWFKLKTEEQYELTGEWISTDAPDVAISLLKEDFKMPFLTHELVDYDNSLIVSSELPKLIFPEASIGSLDKDGYFIVTGTVQNKIVDGVRLERKNAVHMDLRYSETLKDGDILLSYPAPVYQTEWAGLSGSPVLDATGALVGMLLRASEVSNEVLVKPMAQIIRFLDYVLKVEP